MPSNPSPADLLGKDIRTLQRSTLVLLILNAIAFALTSAVWVWAALLS